MHAGLSLIRLKPRCPDASLCAAASERCFYCRHCVTTLAALGKSFVQLQSVVADTMIQQDHDEHVYTTPQIPGSQCFLKSFLHITFLFPNTACPANSYLYFAPAARDFYLPLAHIGDDVDCVVDVCHDTMCYCSAKSFSHHTRWQSKVRMDCSRRLLCVRCGLNHLC